MEEKKLLGIAYILIPGLNILSCILLIIGWIKLGNKYKEKLWKWVGYSAISWIIASVLAIVVILVGVSRRAMPSFVDLIPLIILALPFPILQLIGLWKAGTRFNSGLLKTGGILSIIPILNFVGDLLAGIGFLTLEEG